MMDVVEAKDDEAKSKVTLLPPPPSLSDVDMTNGQSMTEHAEPNIKAEKAVTIKASPSSPSTSSLPLPRPSSSSSSSPSLKAEFDAASSPHSRSSPSSSRSPSASSSSHAASAAAPPAASSSSSTTSNERKGREAANGQGAVKLTQVATSLPPPRKKKAAAANVEAPPQIVDHLPVANDEALSTFTQLQDNWYANKHIGRSKGHEWGLVCECNYRAGRDDLSRACTDEGGCINRLTQVECVASDCRCGQDCQNQRFQRKEYADVDVVKTEKKGFGLRAKTTIPADTFVYEYIGEVVPEHDFRRRMQRYHDERVPHFYFMMLQRDEYLDATKKGGIARFINHSCNPNCFVAKWHVGKHMRMGIFSQRDIVKGEELTFNYNVDRYGNEAQPCYCGEPNCVGQLGGKTQTDIGGMSNLYIEALGIVDEVELLQARGSRKQKSRTLDEDFNPTLHPMEEDEVPTVATAIRQAASSNRAVLSKLLARIDMTDDVAVQKRFVRLHGFVLMSGVLTEWRDDRDVILMCMRILAKWPLIARNKVVDTGVEGIVQGFKDDSEDVEIKTLAGELYDAWQQLSLEFRIARKEGGEDGEGEGAGGADEEPDTSDALRSRRRRDEGDDAQERMDYALDHAQAPKDVSAALGKFVPRPLGTTPSTPASSSGSRFGRPPPGRSGGGGWAARLPSRPSLGVLGTPGTPQTPDEGAGSAVAATASTPSQPTLSIEEIIRRANEAQEAERKQAEEEAKKELEARRKEEARALTISASKSKGKHRDRDRDRPSSSSSSSRKRHRSSKPVAPPTNGDSVSGEDHHKRPKIGDEESMSKPSSSSTSSERSLDKRLHILVGEVVVRVLSKDRDRLGLDRDGFKRHARELTDLVCEKEKRNATKEAEDGTSWFAGKDEKELTLGPEKAAKIKKFAKSYVDKLVARREAKMQQQQQSEGGGSASGGATATPVAGTAASSSASSTSASTTTGTPNSSSTAATSMTAGASSSKGVAPGPPPPPPGPPPPRPGPVEDE